ncbi:hypothetical protein [Actinomadura flavalba]|uniref:hypothetical protein n=1 Tax=Actinomadura flavalba TaxID=1120938 RepID=UPI0012DEEB53|nr:hypothetical protein [Actinomadura flavalba]
MTVRAAADVGDGGASGLVAVLSAAARGEAAELERPDRLAADGGAVPVRLGCGPCGEGVAFDVRVVGRGATVVVSLAEAGRLAAAARRWAAATSP